MCFASSLIGNHIITTELLGAGLLEDASVVYDFALGEPPTFGATEVDAMRNFATATPGDDYNGQRQYATTKLFSSWWSAAMARRHTGSTRFPNVWRSGPLRGSVSSSAPLAVACEAWH